MMKVVEGGGGSGDGGSDCAGRTLMVQITSFGDDERLFHWASTRLIIPLSMACSYQTLSGVGMEMTMAPICNGTWRKKEREELRTRVPKDGETLLTDDRETRKILEHGTNKVGGAQCDVCVEVLVKVVVCVPRAAKSASRRGKS